MKLNRNQKKFEKLIKELENLRINSVIYNTHNDTYFVEYEGQADKINIKFDMSKIELED